MLADDLFPSDDSVRDVFDVVTRGVLKASFLFISSSILARVSYYQFNINCKSLTMNYFVIK